MNMIIHQTTINNYVIFAVGSLTVKHRIVDIAMKNIPVAAELLFARKNSVSAPRHYDVRRASQAPWMSMARWRGRCD
jgi:hypothetical protein